MNTLKETIDALTDEEMSEGPDVVIPRLVTNLIVEKYNLPHDEVEALRKTVRLRLKTGPTTNDRMTSDIAKALKEIMPLIEAKLAGPDPSTMTEEEMLDDFKETVARTKKMSKTGNGAAFKEVYQFIDDALEKGGTVVDGGRLAEKAGVPPGEILAALLKLGLVRVDGGVDEERGAWLTFTGDDEALLAYVQHLGSKMTGSKKLIGELTHT